MKPLGPTFLAELLPKIDQKLLELLQSLKDSDWHKATPAAQWSVQDVATHLLDGNIRTLSMLRDHFFGESAEGVDSYEGMVKFLNGLNADWVKAMKRVSPQVIVELLAWSGQQYCDYLQTLDPFDKSPFSVAWAGENESYNWFHIAREYTEKWHHQQQIRWAVGQEAILYSQEYYLPYLDTSMRGLPHHYRTLAADQGDLIQFTVTGDGGGSWFLYWDDSSWQLVTDVVVNATCEVSIPTDIAWRIFTKGINREDALAQSEIKGKHALGNHVFDMIAVMA